MFKKVIFLLILSFLTVSSCRTVNSNGHETSVNDILPRTSFLFIHKLIKIYMCTDNICTAPKVWNAYGSGAVIHNNDAGSFILTAAHVCLNSQVDTEYLKYKSSFSVTSFDGEKFTAEIINYDKKIDACILYAKGLDVKSVKFANRSPEPGDKVYNVAAPLGIFNPGSIPILEGRYIGIANWGAALYSIPAAPGSSGSPVFNHEGRLIGMIYAVYEKFDTVSISVTYEELKAFLNITLKDYKLYGKKGCSCNHDIAHNN